MFHFRKSYAVTITYRNDGDVAVYLFRTEQEAVKFLREAYEGELRFEREETNWDVKGCIFDDGHSAKITTQHVSYVDGVEHRSEDRVQYRIGRVYSVKHFY